MLIYAKPPKKQPCTCFNNRLLALVSFRLSQTPGERTDRSLIARVAFFIRTLFAPALKMLMCSVYAFEGLRLHILWMFGIVRGGSVKFRQMVDLIIKRHEFASIFPHLRTHLEHVVLELLLVFQRRKKPLLLQRRGICAVFKCAFHRLSRFTSLTPFKWVADTQPCDCA